MTNPTEAGVPSPDQLDGIRDQAGAMMAELQSTQAQLAAAAATLDGIRAMSARIDELCSTDGPPDVEALERLRDELLASLRK